MKIVVLAVGRPREKRLASLADEYLARIRPAGLVGVERDTYRIIGIVVTRIVYVYFSNRWLRIYSYN